MSGEGRRHLLDRLGDRARVREPRGRLAPWVVRALAGPLGALVRLAFRPRMTGWENLPEDRPFLLIANHSASGTAEGAALALLWAERHGSSRQLAPMGHALPLALPVIGDFLGALGLVPSTRAAVLETLSQGVPVLMFPGGDHEAWRPVWQANHVDLAGRRGFLRIARDACVPIVPLAIQGSHYTVPILWRSRWLPILSVWPRLIGVKRMPIVALNLALALATAWFLAPSLGWPLAAAAGWCWIYAAPLWWLPLVPATVRMTVGAPLEPDVLFDSDSDDALDHAYDAVETRLQELVSELAAS